jgi:hypothetical protein
MLHYLILSLIFKQNILIGSGTLHGKVNLCTMICNVKNGKNVFKPELISYWIN